MCALLTFEYGSAPTGTRLWAFLSIPGSLPRIGYRHDIVLHEKKKNWWEGRRWVHVGCMGSIAKTNGGSCRNIHGGRHQPHCRKRFLPASYPGTADTPRAAAGSMPQTIRANSSPRAGPAHAPVVNVDVVYTRPCSTSGVHAPLRPSLQVASRSGQPHTSPSQSQPASPRSAPGVSAAYTAV